jgi:hypothetical protein
MPFSWVDIAGLTGKIGALSFGVLDVSVRGFWGGQLHKAPFEGEIPDRRL